MTGPKRTPAPFRAANEAPLLGAGVTGQKESAFLSATLLHFPAGVLVVVLVVVFRTRFYDEHEHEYDDDFQSYKVELGRQQPLGPVTNVPGSDNHVLP